MSTPDLAHCYAQVHRLLRGEATAEEAALALGVDVGRTAAYQRFVKGHIAGALEKTYTLMPAVVGVAHWHALVDDYFASHPPTHFELNACTESFVGFLEARLAAGDPKLSRFHVELARLEWLELAVSLTEVECPAAVDTITLNPTLAIFAAEYPVARFALAVRAGREPVVPQEESELSFVLRHLTTLRYRTVVASDALLFAFKVAYEQLTVEGAAEASGLCEADVNAALHTGMQAGIVLLPREQAAGLASSGDPSCAE